MAVGAGILSIITESLYDKPIVVFREYVQNSADAFLRVETQCGNTNHNLKSLIWRSGDDLLFLDNGSGIDRKSFVSTMKNIATSDKKRKINMGYKGIGRLSGFSYCNELELINICSYRENKFQKYTLHREKFDKIKNSEKFSTMEFDELLDEISIFSDGSVSNENTTIKTIIKDYIEEDYSDMFSGRDTGFLVILRGISSVLSAAINDADFINKLSWLLPVKFKDELLSDTNTGNLFVDLVSPEDPNILPIKAYSVIYNKKLIERPIEINKLRTYTCIRKYNYAIGFHSFERDRLTIKKSNDFCGIRIYIDNMLLCDENELLPALIQFGLIERTINELTQTAKSIGAMIYITDKVNIVANARRTFIDVADTAAVEFLTQMAIFIEEVYQARYALSKYYNAKTSHEKDEKKLSALRERAICTLQDLAKKEVDISIAEENASNFNSLTIPEKKRVIKKKINRELSKNIDLFMEQKSEFELDTIYKDFVIWLTATNS